MTTSYGRQLGSPHDPRALHTRDRQLWWSRHFGPDPNDLGDAWNSNPVPADFGDVERRIDSVRRSLWVRAQAGNSTGNPGVGTEYPRGTSFLFPDWLQGATAMPPLFPDVTDDFVRGFRLFALHAKLRLRTTINNNLNPAVGPSPCASLALTPDFFVGDQATPRFWLAGMRQDFSLMSLSADTPPATYSTIATPPGTTNALWRGRPAGASVETWDGGPLQNDGRFSPNWGNSLFLRIWCQGHPKGADVLSARVEISSNGDDWQVGGNVFIDTSAVAPGETAIRRVGLSVRGMGWGELEFVRIYYGQIPGITDAAQLQPTDPWAIDDSLPSLGASFFQTT